MGPQASLSGGEGTSKGLRTQNLTSQKKKTNEFVVRMACELQKLEEKMDGGMSVREMGEVMGKAPGSKGSFSTRTGEKRPFQHTLKRSGLKIHTESRSGGRGDLTKREESKYGLICPRPCYRSVEGGRVKKIYGTTYKKKICEAAPIAEPRQVGILSLSFFGRTQRSKLIRSNNEVSRRGASRIKKVKSLLAPEERSICPIEKENKHRNEGSNMVGLKPLLTKEGNDPA